MRKGGGLEREGSKPKTSEVPDGFGVEGNTEGGRIEVERPTMAVIGIFTAPSAGSPMISHKSISAVMNFGLKEDRYNLRVRKGAYSNHTNARGTTDADRQVTIISSRAIDAANRELSYHVSPEDTRRNIVVDIDPQVLNALAAGQRFTIGDADFEGVQVCEPCRIPSSRMNPKQDGKEFERAFAKRGGIRAKVRGTGEIKLGDKLVLLSPPRPRR